MLADIRKGLADSRSLWYDGPVSGDKSAFTPSLPAPRLATLRPPTPRFYKGLQRKSWDVVGGFLGCFEGLGPGRTRKTSSVLRA